MRRRFPKRIILSRKGWDYTAGGKPSPILPDGTLVTLPIPDRDSGIRFKDLRVRDGPSLGPLVESLTFRRIVGENEVHLDPDLSRQTIDRADFRAAFGQSGGAQTHLKNQGVTQGPIEENGDLFLFFGLFQPVSSNGQGWKYSSGVQPIHAMFGWLQIERVLRPATDKVPPELARHPHAVPSELVRNELEARRKDNNTIYIARSRLSFLPEVPGAGMFDGFDVANYDDPRRLTHANNCCSQWRLPSFFSSLSNMGKQPEPINGWWYPQRRGPGQEFVLSLEGCEREAEHWLISLFKTSGSGIP